MIRKAAVTDVRGIYDLLRGYGARGQLLTRPLSQIYDHLRDFWVWKEGENDRVTGCCALQFCWEDLAEIRSLAVHPDHVQKGIGSHLLETALTEARAFGIRQVFTLTYQTGFFKKMGFSPIDRSELPLKIWSDCVACVKFPNCDENAMIMILSSPPSAVS
jgi:amino-acid N-acetyltransferase